MPDQLASVHHEKNPTQRRGSTPANVPSSDLVDGCGKPLPPHMQTTHPDVPLSHAPRPPRSKRVQAGGDAI